MQRLSFAGHETFVCKQFWLKKGYDYIQSGKGFSDKEAIVELGVGKNMVNAIQFWMKAFGLLAEDNKTLLPLAHTLFDSRSGKDPFLEDLGTLWLLHYSLVKTQRASIYSLIFNELRKERFEFNKDILLNFIKRKCEAAELQVSENSISSDIGVFLKTYIQPKAEEKTDIEDAFAGLLLDLDLIEAYKKLDVNDKTVEWYKVASEARLDLPFHVILYVILDMLEGREEQTSITFKELQYDANSPVLAFAMTPDSLFEKLQEITDYYKGDIVYSESAGVQVLQFKSSNISKEKVLNDYYNA